MDHSGDQAESDQEKFVRFGLLLVDELRGAIDPWVCDVVEARVPGVGRVPEEAARVSEVAKTVETEVLAAVEQLVAKDVDDQQDTPLAIVRRAAGHLTALLEDLGAEKPPRGDFEVRMAPDDHFSIGPASWIDLGENVSSAAISWGAAKAYVHLKRHQD